MLSEPAISAEMLNKRQIPVSIIGGNRDMIRYEHMKWIPENVADGRFTILNGETHGSYVINNEKLASIIIAEVRNQLNK